VGRPSGRPTGASASRNAAPPVAPGVQGPRRGPLSSACSAPGAHRMAGAGRRRLRPPALRPAGVPRQRRAGGLLGDARGIGLRASRRELAHVRVTALSVWPERAGSDCSQDDREALETAACEQGTGLSTLVGEVAPRPRGSVFGERRSGRREIGWWATSPDMRRREMSSARSGRRWVISGGSARRWHHRVVGGPGGSLPQEPSSARQ